MKRAMGVAICALVLGAGCDCYYDDCWDCDDDDDRGGWYVCPGDGCPDCPDPEPDPDPDPDPIPECTSDVDCDAGWGCFDGWCIYVAPDWCRASAACGPDRVCSLDDTCVDVVLGCPLTDECLGDPEGYVPEWQGIDPLFVGDATGNGHQARLELLVDFYEDHLYGEAMGWLLDDQGNTLEWLDLIVTGQRDGAELQGQIVERFASPRRFDATFTATLDTASWIRGTATVCSDDGTTTLTFSLGRTSPCGCD